ncbi:MAG TPA: hypothetical protein VFS67_08700 [Polyangiaceae bacterium]|jgi:hypothetical protein|nr:hypothetical protein [Polyangiaceae bacterium]
MYQPNRRLGLLFWTATTLSCGAAQMEQQVPPSHRVASAISAAERAGAADYAPAQRLVERARLEMMRSRQAENRLANEHAQLLLEQARMDAVLAQQLLRTREEERETRALSAALQSPPEQHP